MATKKAPAKKATAVAKKTASKPLSGKATAPAKAAASASVPRMTKTQVIRHMAERLEVAPRQITAFFDLLIETAVSQTQSTGEFTVPGLGKLVKAERKARTGRNPATGEALQIPAKTTVKFRLAKGAKDAVVPPGR